MIKEKNKKYKGTVVIKNLTTGEIRVFKNIVTQGFYDLIANLMASGGANEPSHLAIGDDNTPVTEVDTVMGNETFRKILSSVTNSGDVLTYTVTVTGSEAVITWKELGIFNAASVGTMVNHINVDFIHSSGDIISITWNVEPES